MSRRVLGALAQKGKRSSDNRCPKRSTEPFTPCGSPAPPKNPAQMWFIAFAGGQAMLRHSSPAVLIVLSASFARAQITDITSAAPTAPITITTSWGRSDGLRAFAVAEDPDATPKSR